jgi:hypothetical protein
MANVQLIAIRALIGIDQLPRSVTCPIRVDFGFAQRAVTKKIEAAIPFISRRQFLSFGERPFCSQHLDYFVGRLNANGIKVDVSPNSGKFGLFLSFIGISLDSHMQESTKCGIFRPHARRLFIMFEHEIEHDRAMSEKTRSKPNMPSRTAPCVNLPFKFFLAKGKGPQSQRL